MHALQIVATVVAWLAFVAAVVMAARAVRHFVRLFRVGAADPDRFTDKGRRTGTMLREILGHTRMLKWTRIGVAHWFVMVAFGALIFTLVEAHGEVSNPRFHWPLFGGWAVYGLVMELIAGLCWLGISFLIVTRWINLPRWKSRSRFLGSTAWQAYYVEWTVFTICASIFAIRAFKVAAGDFPYPTWATPLSHGLGALFSGLSESTALNLVTVAALVKILVSWIWFIVISLNLTMGVAWHRFLAFFNIFFKRNADGAVALGPLRPMMSGGKPLDFEEADPEKDPFGVSQVEQFTWKGLLDFSTCTECGRCQSQCPAWNTGKPLSPKLMIMSLRDHAHAKAPYLMAGGGKDAAGEETATQEQLAGVDALALAEADRPLIGGPDDNGIIDPDVLWSCTTCGACVEQCPVDIEHVDHIVDMRRYQVLIESSFPTEAGVMLRNLENKGNPWGANPNTREDWTKSLDFEIPRVGSDEAADFEYLYWVGCAGAFDDRAKKTAKAVATLLHEAGVKFAILGEGETCTGDPARRMGNEFLFQMMAQQNVETLNEAFEGREGKAQRKIVASCPHCFNTLGREYPQVGGEYSVVHHTQLLADLVAAGKLTPVTPVDGGVTFHDPCYLGRHNRVFAPPREVLGAVADARASQVGSTGDGAAADGGGVTEMSRFAERSFCCGAGGARMWMEERIGKRINIERVEEARSTGAKTLAVACPFCMTMMSDGVNATKPDGVDAEQDVEVVDVATVLLRSLGDGARG
ncbi:(Fe-S)-binding protein [Actinocatenispora rupis]|uniref:Fe-S oxidoreductase n=1 Tax=Actinocatenispora rupis TaxID=519421 RepID=A0A8J3J1G9_9ACTN|nr:(Fe-S)-binding protein [Actinocatenispora rupis]GID14036.1 Fe-S oxidoreductase [Actinocatenispora rupis]